MYITPTQIISWLYNDLYDVLQLTGIMQDMVDGQPHIEETLEVSLTFTSRPHM